MASDFLYPSNAELTQINQDLIPRLMANRRVFDPGVFPMTNADAARVMWEQADNYWGLQQLRGLDGKPPVTQKVGVKRWAIEPGVYGEFELITETELTERRAYGSFAAPIDVADLVMAASKRLLQRRLDRIESIIWTLLVTGTFSVAGPAGATIHKDTYTTQTYTASTPWATAATSTPLADFRAVQLKHRGHSVDFGARALAFMSRVTFNQMINNTNSADLYGRRTAGLGTFNNEAQVNQLMAGDDLPTLVVYDEGYLADASGTFTPFLADAKVVVIGKRADGAPVGEYKMTRNANNPGLAPGPYTRVVDDEDALPRQIEVHDGHNGGPALYYPSAIVSMSV